MTHFSPLSVAAPQKYLLFCLVYIIHLAFGISAQAQFIRLDSTFGVNGFVLPAYSGADQAHAVLVQPADQKIVVAGFHGGNCYVARFLPTGQSDAAFGIGGRTTFQFGTGSSYGYALALQADGKILVAGDASSSSAGLARLTTTGALDATFGSGGKITVPTPNVSVFDSDAKLGLAVQATDQRIVLGITSAPDAAANKMATIHRFLPNGSADLSFSGDGKAFIDFSPGKRDVVSGLAIQPDGKIVVGAFASIESGNYGNYFAVGRLNKDGSLDTDFGNGGITVAGKGVLLDLSIQPDGKIMTAGYNRYFPLGLQEEKDIALMRFLPNGALDPTFGNAGITYTDYNWCHANGMTLQPDGKIVVVGFLHPNNPFDFLAGRYNANGSLDLAFYPNGFWNYRINGKDEELHKVAMQANGDIVAVGYYELGGQDESVLVRLTPKKQTPQLPIANFTASPTTGCGPISVQFSDQSANATGWAWQFPGGTPATSTQQNPTVTYATAGTHTVTLVASNPAGNHTASKPGFITVNPLPTAAFSTAVNGAAVTFANTSQHATEYIWNFGDGQSSTLQSPTHTYTSNGTYTITLTAKNACGIAAITQQVVIAGSGLVAQFSSTTPVGCAPLSVQFKDESQNATTWQWTFPGGNPGTSTAQHPTVTYTSWGEYDVTLTVSHPTYGSKTKTIAQFVEVESLPNAQFTIISLGGQSYQFQNSSTHANGYIWAFPGGTPATSTEVNPTVTYATPGAYKVQLSAVNDCGASILEKTLATSSAAEPAWAEGLRLFPNPTGGLFQIELRDAPNGEATFTVFDLNGQNIQSISAIVRDGLLTQRLDCSGLPPAFYLVRMNIAGQALTRRLVIIPN